MLTDKIEVLLDNQYEFSLSNFINGSTINLGIIQSNTNTTKLLSVYLDEDADNTYVNKNATFDILINSQWGDETVEDEGGVEGVTKDRTQTGTGTYSLLGTGDTNGTGSGTEITDENGEDQTEETTDEKEVLGEDIISCDNPITLQGYLYLDKNKNDQMDEKEKGIAGVNIRIYYIYEGNEITIDDVTTDENGYWQTEVCPAEYFLEVNKEDLPKHLSVQDVLSLTVSEDSNDPTEFNISAIDTRNFWQKYWYLILIGAALLITTIYLILSRKEKEQPIQ